MEKVASLRMKSFNVFAITTVLSLLFETAIRSIYSFNFYRKRKLKMSQVSAQSTTDQTVPDEEKTDISRRYFYDNDEENDLDSIPAYASNGNKMSLENVPRNTSKTEYRSEPPRNGKTSSNCVLINNNLIYILPVDSDESMIRMESVGYSVNINYSHNMKGEYFKFRMIMVHDTYFIQ